MVIIKVTSVMEEYHPDVDYKQTFRDTKKKIMEICEEIAMIHYRGMDEFLQASIVPDNSGSRYGAIVNAIRKAFDDPTDGDLEIMIILTLRHRPTMSTTDLFEDFRLKYIPKTGVTDDEIKFLRLLHGAGFYILFNLEDVKENFKLGIGNNFYKVVSYRVPVKLEKHDGYYNKVYRPIRTDLDAYFEIKKLTGFNIKKNVQRILTLVRKRPCLLKY